MTIQRSFNNPTGTLHTFYTGKKLDHFSFEKAGKTTEIALSKIWVNGCPALYLKGFKSISLEDIEFALNNDTCDITLPPFKTINITIKIEDKDIELQVPENLKITGLKKIIAKQLRIDDSLQLKHQGYALDGSITLGDSGFEDGTELTLNLPQAKQEKPSKEEKLTDGALELGGGFSRFDYVSPDTPIMEPIAYTGAQWHIVRKGLNLKAECTTEKCQAFQKTIYIPKGMGTFNMAEHCCEIICPACNESSTKDATNCGFMDCTYSITGKTEDGSRFEQKEKIAPKEALLTFEKVVDGKSNMAKWKFLKIVTEPCK